MMNRRDTLALLGATLAGGVAKRGAAETGVLADKVASGDLPALAERLPKPPRVVNLAAIGRMPGRQGGTIRALIGGQRDVRYMPVFGYARLVVYDLDLALKPDVLEACDVERERVFTLKIRDGHRWSDGSPFTAEDFRFFWEDIASNTEFYPEGPPNDYRVNDNPPQFEVLDELRVRYSWPDPAPEFLPNLARPAGLRIMVPAHYLKPFHPRYGDPAAIDQAIELHSVDDWIGLHQKLSRTNRPENPDLPTLEPWVPRTAPPADQFVFERNPYFHRVDENGVQLPYIDSFVLGVSSADLITAKTATGESDLQFVGLDLADYPVLKQAEKLHPVKVHLWKLIQGARVALAPNLNCADPGFRSMMRDVRVRRALSLAVNREEINQALFYGLATPSANTLLPESPLFRPEYAAAYSNYDPDEANRLLDEAGYTERTLGDVRLLPDGRPANIIVESAGESTLETDVLELIRDHYRQIGIAIFPRSSQREIFRSRALGGQIVMSALGGIDNGIATADMPPAQFAPTLDDQLQWPLWGANFLSGEVNGEAPDMPEVQELVELFKSWRKSESTQEREGIWAKMLQINAENVFTIGTVNGALQPIARSEWLRNLPDVGLHGFDPCSLLGIYMPDTFWKEDTA